MYEYNMQKWFTPIDTPKVKWNFYFLTEVIVS